MIPLAAKLLVCSAMFIWAASASVGADPDAAEERSIPCDDVPAAVRIAFGKSFPNATVLSCVKEEEMGKPAYELTSTEGETTRDLFFDPDGTLLVVEEAIAAASLPKAVKQTWKERFANYTIVLVEKVTRRNVVTYEIQSTNLGKLSENVFDGSFPRRDSLPIRYSLQVRISASDPERTLPVWTARLRPPATG